MKRLMILSLMFSFAIGMLVVSSCDKTEFSSVVLGVAEAMPSIVKNGDEIVLSIGGKISSSGSSSVNGKEFYPVVHYLIDGNEVAVSSSKEMPFEAKCVVSNMSVGEHALTVNITGSRKGAHFDNNVSSSTILVTE